MDESNPPLEDTDWDETEKAIQMRFPSVLVIDTTYKYECVVAPDLFSPRIIALRSA